MRRSPCAVSLIHTGAPAAIRRGVSCSVRARVRGVDAACTGFKTLEVKCPQKWKSHKVTLWLHSSGFVKVVAVKSKEEAVRVAVSFEHMVQSVRGFRDVCLLQESGVELSEWGVQQEGAMRDTACFRHAKGRHGPEAGR